jgi:hypothetical protein
LKHRPPVFSLEQVRYLLIRRHSCHLQSLIVTLMYAWKLRTSQKDASKKADIHQHSH